jgi:2-polyprenyl-3-methyl-5-hydroxy-6-metoxy-1,4-benzoquinol methylase
VRRAARDNPVAGENLTKERDAMPETELLPPPETGTAALEAKRMHRACPICGGARLKRLWDLRGDIIVRCEGCSLVFVQNEMTPEELNALYADPDGSYDEDNSDCLKYYCEILRGLIESRCPQRGRILDIGCAAGWFLDLMKGWECHGNEISPAYARIAGERFGDRIVNCLFEDYPLRENYFDVITLQDVFDHLRDPVAILRKCYAMLKPGGTIVIKVHNISCLYAKVTGPRFYALQPGHLFYYSKRTLELLLRKTGFQLTDARFIPHILRIRIVFHRLARGNRNSIFYRIARRLRSTWLGDVKIRKNLHDIITVIAVKN